MFTKIQWRCILGGIVKIVSNRISAFIDRVGKGSNPSSSQKRTMFLHLLNTAELFEFLGAIFWVIKSLTPMVGAVLQFDLKLNQSRFGSVYFFPRYFHTSNCFHDIGAISEAKFGWSKYMPVESGYSTTLNFTPLTLIHANSLQNPDRYSIF